MAERFSASVAGRHMACHASANLDLAIPGWVPPVRDPMKGAKGEGTKVHLMFAEAMALGTADLGHFIAALQYVQQIRTRRRWKVLIEQDIEAKWLVSKPKTQVDLVLYTQDEIHIVDWKWGKIPVEVIDNEQLLYYALAFAPFAPKAKGVTLHVVQPRANAMEEWFVSTTELAEFMERTKKAELAVISGDTTFGPSKHCTFCPAYPHSRGDKGTPLCPATMAMLYPKVVDEDDILSL